MIGFIHISGKAVKRLQSNSAHPESVRAGVSMVVSRIVILLQL